MPKFSIKDLLIATTLVAAGLATCVVACDKRWLRLDESALVLLPIVFFLLGSAIVGSGLLYPFKQAWRGFLFGPVVVLILFGLFLFLAQIAHS